MLFVTIASEGECQALRDLTRQAAGRVALRALMVLWSAEGTPVGQIAARLSRRPKTVRKWLRRFARGGVAALVDLPRSGRPATTAGVAAQAVWRNCTSRPPASATSRRSGRWRPCASTWLSAVRCRSRAGSCAN